MKTGNYSIFNTIARNLCRQYYRDKTIVYSLDEAISYGIYGMDG